MSEVMIKERVFFCQNCKQFVDTRENQNDIVCDVCDWIVASFHDRDVYAPVDSLEFQMSLATESFRVYHMAQCKCGAWSMEIHSCWKCGYSREEVTLR